MTADGTPTRLPMCAALALGLALALAPRAASAAGDPEWDLFALAPAPRPPSATIVKPDRRDTFPFLPDERPGRSMSVGTVTDGYVVNALPLPLPGRTYSVLPRQFRRHLAYGTEELISAIVGASEYVDRVYPGSVLWLGNIGRRSGGDIPWSVSHNSGRDADLAFYATDPSGNVVHPPDLLHFGADGRSREYGGFYRFDDARNWALVKALTLSPHAQVQYLFISSSLRARLLEHARRRGESPAVTARAAGLMQQPGGALPHDDHLHLRVYCSAADVTGGCVHTGRTHLGADLHAAGRAARIDRAAAMLGAADADTRARAIERLAMLGAASRLDAIRRRLSDPSPVVRAAAVEAIATLGTERVAGWLVLHWEEEASPFVRERSVRALGSLGGREAGLFFASQLGAPAPVEVGGKRYDLRVEMVDAVRRSGRAEPAFALVALLRDADYELRARAAESLRHLANRDLDRLDWRQPLSVAQIDTAVTAWRTWLDGMATTPRETWVAQGFTLLGVPEQATAAELASHLARLAGDERSWVRTNAQTTLMRMTGNTPRSLQWPPADARTYWERWVSRNPRRITAP